MSKSGDPPIRWYRQEEKNSNSESEDDNYIPYVPVKERKKQQLLKLGRISQVHLICSMEIRRILNIISAGSFIFILLYIVVFFGEIVIIYLIKERFIYW